MSRPSSSPEVCKTSGDSCFRRNDSNAAGFTLPELLVALAIFISVMTGIALLFISSLRTMRQGFQTQEAFETARSALKVIERDLNRAFTSRDYGEYYTFYGSPIGMCFVGLVSPRESASPNLSRVTYVIYHSTDQRIDPALPPTTSQIINSDLETIDQEVKRSYKLLRFVEPNANTLDEFPVDWYNVALLNPDLSPSVNTLGSMLDEAVVALLPAGCDTLPLNGIATRIEDPRLFDCVFDESQRDQFRTKAREMVRAKKRELWIRLMSGGDVLVPNGWERQGILGVNLNPNRIEDPDDYVVAENLIHVFPYKLPTDPPSAAYREFDIFSPPQILYQADAAVMNLNFGMFVQPGTLGAIAYDVNELNVSPPPQTYSGVLPSTFFTYRDFQQRGQIDPLTGNPLIIDGEQVVDIEPVVTRYWNDARNFEIPNNGLDDDLDTFVDEEPYQAGSPLLPRLPQEITTHFTFLFESPYAGAPDFRKNFDQRIDVPSAYKRQPKL